MIAIGLTGGIGAGKSAVADLFAKKGVPIIDADIIAREITAPNQPALKEIVAHFGQSILDAQGRLNRSALRTIIFDNEDERKWLESCLHPPILKRIQERIHALKNASYCLVVIPLLVEAKAYSFLHRILVVDALPDIQLARVMHRDQLNTERVSAMMAAQVERAERLKVADDIIENNGSLEELALEVEKLHRIYLELSSRKQQ